MLKIPRRLILLWVTWSAAGAALERVMAWGPSPGQPWVRPRTEPQRRLDKPRSRQRPSAPQSGCGPRRDRASLFGAKEHEALRIPGRPVAQQRLRSSLVAVPWTRVPKAGVSPHRSPVLGLARAGASWHRPWCNAAHEPKVKGIGAWVCASSTTPTLRRHRCVSKNGFVLGARRSSNLMRLKYVVVQNLHNHITLQKNKVT